MTNQNKPFLRAHCESCGGALGTPDRNGRVVCAYCGSVYIASGYQPAANSPVEERESLSKRPASHSPAPKASKPVPISHQPVQKKTLQWWVAPVGLAGMGLAGAVLILLLLVGTNMSGSGRANNDAVPAESPVMLDAIPGQPVPGGTAVNLADWGLTVSPEISIASGEIGVSITVHNYSNLDRVFRYTPNGIQVTDDRGNTYPATTGGSCAIDMLFLDKQITIPAGKSVVFSSGTSWCSRNSAIGLPMYAGVIPVDASMIIVNFENFGVYAGLVVQLDL